MIKSIHSFILFGAIAVSSLLFSSCSNPLDKEYHRHTAEDDYRRIVEMEKLDSAETKLLAKFMVEHGLIGSHVLEYHATYRHILDEAKKAEENKKIEQEKAQKKNDYAMHTLDKLKNLSKSLKVTILDNPMEEETEEDPKAKTKGKKTEPIDKNILSYRIAFINIGTKDIKAFKGEVMFVDLFQAKVRGITISNFQGLAVADTIEQVVKVNLNEVNTSSTLSLGLNREFIKPEWHPERIIYKDGQIIE
jgi:hypothetical protein